MRRQPFPVLISSAGRRVGLVEIWRTTLHELGLSGDILATDVTSLSSAYHRADRAFLVPPVTSADFVPKMLEICAEHRVRLIIPTIDTELPVYARHRKDFQKVGTDVAVSTPEVIDISRNKMITHSWLTSNKFPTVRQATVPEVLEAGTEWKFPLIIKPVDGSASKGVATIYNPTELSVRTQNGAYIVQTIAPGKEHTVDILVNREGRALIAIPRRRIEVRSGEVSKGIVVRDELIEKLARQICETLPGTYGVINIQMFVDRASSSVAVIEINPRFGGGFPLAWQAGGKYPRWMIEEILGLPSTLGQASIKDRLLMMRYDEAVYADGSKLDV